MAESAMPITFANQSFTLQPNSIKLIVEIFNWPFVTYKNTLQVLLGVSIQTEVT
jgi:hypothetical protein